jgi:hypothetical protein
MSWLRLTAISNCFPHPYETCKGFEHIDMLSIGIQQQPYTVYPQYRLIFWGSGSLETDSHLKLLSTSILDIYNMFEHIYMLFIDIQQQPYTVIPTLLGSDFGVLGHLWSQNDVITSWLCRNPPRDVPYKCTSVLYNGTFGASDQGQMLDV